MSQRKTTRRILGATANASSAHLARAGLGVAWLCQVMRMQSWRWSFHALLGAKRLGGAGRRCVIERTQHPHRPTAWRAAGGCGPGAGYAHIICFAFRASLAAGGRIAATDEYFIGAAASDCRAHLIGNCAVSASWCHQRYRTSSTRRAIVTRRTGVAFGSRRTWWSNRTHWTGRSYWSGCAL